MYAALTPELSAGVPKGGFATARGTLLESVQGVVARMRDYSVRISAAIPSRKLALEELSRRNGWFLSDYSGSGQELHIELLKAQGVMLRGSQLSLGPSSDDHGEP